MGNWETFPNFRWDAHCWFMLIVPNVTLLVIAPECERWTLVHLHQFNLSPFFAISQFSTSTCIFTLFAVCSNCFTHTGFEILSTQQMSKLNDPYYCRATGDNLNKALYKINNIQYYCNFKIIELTCVAKTFDYLLTKWKSLNICFANNIEK